MNKTAPNKVKTGRPPKGLQKRSELMCIAWTKEEKAFLKAEAIKAATKPQTFIRSLVHQLMQKSI
jgi:hypothetical protein